MNIIICKRFQVLIPTLFMWTSVKHPIYDQLTPDFQSDLGTLQGRWHQAPSPFQGEGAQRADEGTES